MKNKHIKKFLYIACSLFLVFSMCVPNFNLNVSADEPQNTQTQEISETENDSDVPATETNTHESNKEVPDQISVQTLEQTQSDDSTDRVEYVDVNGKVIENAPSTIQFGNIDDHKELNISDVKHYEFISAKVDGKDCVYIGKYENTVYYSTDGAIAIKMEENQKITMTYQEYYNITIKEDIPENGAVGTITHNGNTVSTLNNVRVNAGDTYSFTITPATANKVRYKITSVTSEKNANIKQDSGDEYGATYTATFTQDDNITISYTGEGVYRVHVKDNDNEGNTCINTDKSHYSGTYINDFTFTESDLQGIDKNTITLPIFHTIRGKRIISFNLNGTTLKVDNSHREVPWEKDNPVTVRYAPDPYTVFNIQINIVDDHTAIIGDEKNCSYEYQLTITKKKGEWRDFNFTPTYYDTGHQALSLRLLSTVNGTLQRSEAGMDVVVWDSDNQNLVEAHDNDTYNMDTTFGSTRKQVKFFFAKAKPGYRINIGKSGCGRPYGKTTASDDFGRAVMTVNLSEEVKGGQTSTNFDNNWKQAKEAALAQGYIACIVISGESGYYNEGVGEWELYDAQFVAEADTYYVLYDKGTLPEGVVVSDMPESSLKTKSNKSNSNPYTDLPVFGPRNYGDSFKVGEGYTPKCDGYKFVGWKLVDGNGDDKNIYPNNTLFTIDSSNVAYGNTQFVDTNSYGYDNAYRFVAQWEKVQTKSVKVNHYLKKPDGNKVLGKTTDGSITFSKDNETVTAMAKPEPNGTFLGYIFDKSDERNTLEKTVTNDGSTDAIVLNLYYKPTVLTVSKNVSGYNLEPNRDFEFVIQANPQDGKTMSDIYVQKNDGNVEKLSFTNNQAMFTMKKDETVNISCLPTDWTYTVTEKDPGSNFVASYVIDAGTKINDCEAKFTMPSSGSTSIKYTNTSTLSPPVTGMNINNSDWSKLGIIGLICLIIGFIIERFKKIRR